MKDRVTRELSDTVNYLSDVFGIDGLTLSQILSLRRYIIEALNNNEELYQRHPKNTPSDNDIRMINILNPTYEALTRFFLDYFDIDFKDFFPRDDKGRIIQFVKGLSALIADPEDEFQVSAEFREYLRRKQNAMY